MSYLEEIDKRLEDCFIAVDKYRCSRQKLALLPPVEGHLGLWVEKPEEEGDIRGCSSIK